MDLSRIEYLGLDRVIKRGSADVLADQENALLIRDRVSGAYLLACEDGEDGEAGIKLLDNYAGADCDSLMVSNYKLGLEAFERYGFTDKLECYQVAYYGERPTIDSELFIREANEEDFQVLSENYHLINPDELAAVIQRNTMLMGYYQEHLVGFVGEHLEGGMGLLYVFPEYRRRGFAAKLQNYLIAKTMDEGFVPFGQVERHNQSSLALQAKLGMTCSENLIIWMWKNLS